MFAYPLMHPQTRFLSAWHLSPWSKSRTQVLFCCRYWYYYYNLFSTFFSMNGHVWRKQVLEKVYHQDDEEVRESRKRYAKKTFVALCKSSVYDLRSWVLGTGFSWIYTGFSAIYTRGLCWSVIISRVCDFLKRVHFTQCQCVMMTQKLVTIWTSL